MSKKLQCSHRLLKSVGDMSKKLQCSHRLLKSGGGMTKNVSVLTGY